MTIRAIFATVEKDRRSGMPAQVDAADFILTTEGLTKEFTGFIAVRNVDLRIRRGTIHALIGPNGAGKSTCFNLLTKFLTPSRGRILYNRRELTHPRPAGVAPPRGG